MSLRQSLIMSDGSWTVFAQRPIAASLLALAAGLLAWSTFAYFRRRKDWRSRLAQAESGEKL
jgi:TctA family transporter